MQALAAVVTSASCGLPALTSTTTILAADQQTRLQIRFLPSFIFTPSKHCNMSSLRSLYPVVIKRSPLQQTMWRRAIEQLASQGVLSNEDARNAAIHIGEELLDAEEAMRDPNEAELFLKGQASYVRTYLIHLATTVTDNL